MKKVNLFLITTLLLIISLSSCQKPIIFPEGAGPDGVAPIAINSSMSAKVDGVLVQCTTVTAGLMPITPTETAIQIVGNKGNEGFSLLLDPYVGVGTYLLENGHLCTYTKNATDRDEAYNATIGIVKITVATDKVVKGTFEFKGINLPGVEKTITEGQFEVSLVHPVGPGPDIDDKSMSAKIDGTLTSFAAQAVLMNTPIGKTMTIVGTNGVKILSLVIYDFKGNGVYEIDALAQGAYNEDQGPTGSFMGVSGKITITNFSNTTIQGTFEFEAPNEDSSLTTKKTITDGKFDMGYATL